MSIKVGRVLGVPIEIHATCIIALIILSCSIGLGFIARVHEDIAATTALMAGGVAAMLLFVCLLAHEFAHAAVARQYGINTGSVSLFILGGSAQLAHDPDDWREELAISLAGPAVSIGLAGCLLAVYFLLDSVSLLSTLLFYLAFANAVLGFANLLPGYPLDGGRVLKAILWRILRNRHAATRVATIAGECIGLGIAAWGVVNLLGRSVDGLWLLGVGWYLADAAARAWEQEQVRTILEHSSAADIVTDSPTALSPDDCVSCLTDSCRASGHCHTWPVVDESGPVGVLTDYRAASVPAERRVREVMACVDEMVVVHSDDNAWAVAERVGDLDDNGAVVVADGRSVVGVVEKRELPSLLTARLRAIAR